MTELHATGLALRVDPGGGLAVSSSARPGVRWLARVGPVEVGTPTGPVPLGAPVVSADADEVEVVRVGGGLRVVVRHGVDVTWDVRVVLVNESGSVLDLTEVRLGWCADPGCVAVALAAGAQAAYAVQAADGDGPLLVGRLRSGAQAGADATGFRLGPVTLEPGHRWSASWRFEVVPDARRAAPLDDLPQATWLDLDQTVVLPAGPDVAVVAPRLAAEIIDDRVEVRAGPPGTWGVELRGARGTTAHELTWAPDLDHLVDDVTEQLLDGPRTPAGTPRLPDALAGLVVQDAYARHAVGRSDDLADALDLLAGTVLEGVEEADAPAVDPWTLAFLGREADRTGDAAFADAATRGLLRVRTPVAGTAVVGVALALSLVGAGRRADGVVAQLAALRHAPADPLASLELALLLRPRSEPADATVSAGLRRLGATLGAGLPGRVLPEVPYDRVAHAATVLGLVDESTGQRLAEGWGVSAAELARQAGAQARARVADAAEGDPAARAALGWLVLGRPPR